jgi:hypothetical protein
MKYIILSILFLITLPVVAEPLFVDATAADNFKLYWLVKAKVAPKIDGKLDDAAWKAAKPLQDWGITNYGRQKGKLGEIDFRACWDDDYLYIGARFYHKRKPEDMVTFKNMVNDVSKVIHARECVEIHIDGNLDHATRFQSIVNARSEKWMCWYYDFGWGILENTDYGLDADWDVAGAIEKDSWTIEVRYGLADIQVKPKVGYMFGINPCWFNWSDTREYGDGGYWWQFTTWSTHGDSHHDPRLYGRFILVDKEPESLKEGLKLAYPDLEKQTLMIQSSDGYIIFKDGKSRLLRFDEQVKSEAADTRQKIDTIQKLLADNKTTAVAYIQKNVMPTKDKALVEIEAGLKKPKLSRGEITSYRKTLAELLGSLDDLEWKVRQDILLTSLPATVK